MAGTAPEPGSVPAPEAPGSKPSRRPPGSFGTHPPGNGLADHPVQSTRAWIVRRRSPPDLNGLDERHPVLSAVAKPGRSPRPGPRLGRTLARWVGRRLCGDRRRRWRKRPVLLPRRARPVPAPGRLTPVGHRLGCRMRSAGLVYGGQAPSPSRRTDRDSHSTMRICGNSHGKCSPHSLLRPQRFIDGHQARRHPAGCARGDWARPLTLCEPSE